MCIFIEIKFKWWLKDNDDWKYCGNNVFVRYLLLRYEYICFFYCVKKMWIYIILFVKN